MVDKLGGRKAAACLIGLAVVVVVFLAKGSIPDQLIDIVKYMTATYLAGNIASQIADGVTAVKTKSVDAQVNAPAAAPADDRVDAILQEISQVRETQGVQDAALKAQATTVQEIVGWINTNFPPAK